MLDVGATGRAEVLLPRLEAAGRVVFEIWLVTAQTVLANVELAGPEIRNQNAGVIAALAADDLGTCERIDSSQTSALSNGVVDPSSV
jgi:hypothetical protein